MPLRSVTAFVWAWQQCVSDKEGCKILGSMHGILCACEPYEKSNITFSFFTIFNIKPETAVNVRTSSTKIFITQLTKRDRNVRLYFSVPTIRIMPLIYLYLCSPQSGSYSRGAPSRTTKFCRSRIDPGATSMLIEVSGRSTLEQT